MSSVLQVRQRRGPSHGKPIFRNSDMLLDKSIERGKDWRRPYRGAAALRCFGSIWNSANIALVGGRSRRSKLANDSQSKTNKNQRLIKFVIGKILSCTVRPIFRLKRGRFVAKNHLTVRKSSLPEGI
jgi:hypothetical protein